MFRLVKVKGVNLFVLFLQHQNIYTPVLLNQLYQLYLGKRIINYFFFQNKFEA